MRNLNCNILHVTSTLDPGGIETWLLRLADIPEGRKLIGGILVLSERDGLLAPKFREYGIPIYRMPVSRNSLVFVRDLALLLQRTGPWQVVHSHVYRRSALVHLASLYAGIPLRVTHSHNTNGRDRESRNPMRSVLAWLATRWINTVSQLRMACSRAAADRLFGSGSQRDPSLVCLPCGMDVDGFLQSASIPISRASLRIPENAIVVGHVGRFMLQKNHEFLLHVATDALRVEPRLHFLLVGEGPLRPEMEQLAASLGIAAKVTFTGNRLDVPSLMRHVMDCFFLPSLWEGLGIVALEAQALGLRCLLSDAVPEEANRLSGNNLIFPLQAAAHDVASQLIQMARDAQVDISDFPDPHSFLYSIAENARQLTQAYASALAGQQRARSAISPFGHTQADSSHSGGTPSWN